MMNALIGVLSRFGKEETAVTCDIEQMFHSFHVNPEHRDFLRFLWFKDNNLNGQICEYRMKVHLFGAVSSRALPILASDQPLRVVKSGLAKKLQSFCRTTFT